MQTTLISSHGGHCVRDKGAAVIKLPSNVIVLMNCDNALTYSDAHYDSAFWAFATDNKLHLSMAKNKIDVNSFGKFLKGLEPLNGMVGKDVNNFCVFTDKCPDLLVTFEAKNFRSGIFTLPTKIIIKDEKMKQDVGVTHSMFAKFAEKDPSLLPEYERRVGAWTQYDQYGELYKTERFVVKGKKSFPTRNYEDNKLSKLIKDLCDDEPDKMHFVIAFACRASQKTTMKVQQYSVTRNPYQTAIVLYEKVRKFLESKK